MSRIRDVADYLDRAPRCSFCGATADAVWKGKRTVSVCRTCAVNVLPKLLADSLGNVILQEPKAADVVTHAKLEADLEFWRAMALGRLRDGQ